MKGSPNVKVTLRILCWAIQLVFHTPYVNAQLEFKLYMFMHHHRGVQSIKGIAHCLCVACKEVAGEKGHYPSSCHHLVYLHIISDLLSVHRIDTYFINDSWRNCDVENAHIASKRLS